MCMYVYASLYVYISMIRQVHGKLLAPTTDKTTSGTRMAELMGGEAHKKEEEGEKTA